MGAGGITSISFYSEEEKTKRGERKKKRGKGVEKERGKVSTELLHINGGSLHTCMQEREEGKGGTQVI